MVIYSPIIIHLTELVRISMETLHSYHKTLITNNISVGNIATLNGGGFFIEACNLSFSNNTILSNEAEAFGGGIYFLFVENNNSYNNIVWGNSAQDEGDDLYFYDTRNDFINLVNNIYGEKALLKGHSYSETSPQHVDPLLDEDYSPLSGSPCINSGDNDGSGYCVW